MDKRVIISEAQLEKKFLLAKEAFRLIKEREELLTSVIERTIVDISITENGDIAIDDEFFGEEICNLEEISLIDRLLINGDAIKLILDEREELDILYGRMPAEQWIEKMGLNHYKEKRIEEIYNKLKLIEDKTKLI